MSSNEKNFHDFALKSILFKGRADLYFCYLKSERIAHVLAVLSESVPRSLSEELHGLSHTAAELPETIVHFVAGEVEAEAVLADLFSLLSIVRLCGTKGLLAKENAAIIAKEYELLAEKLMVNVHPSPFTSTEDFAVPHLQLEEESLPLISSRLPDLFPRAPAPIKDSNKGHTEGHNKGHIKTSKTSPEQQDRLAKILAFVRENKSVSIKDIAAVVRDCSEKTIQRELAALIHQGLIKKVGERRWSHYIAL